MFDKLLQTIQDSKVAMEVQQGAIQMEMGLLRADNAKLSERVDTTESSLASLRPSVATIQEQLKEMQAEIRTMSTRAKDAEGRSRRKNVRFLGFPEKSEGPNVELFLEE